jgi:two-component system cell cycle sensor histidine kinase/response regulator CckA
LSFTLLVVEDSEPVRKVIARTLHKEGYAVMDAGSGEEALRVLDHWNGPLDLLITDYDLGAMDGVELSFRARARKPGLPVLFISGAIKEGPSGIFLQKPFALNELLDLVQQMLEPMP